MPVIVVISKVPMIGDGASAVASSSSVVGGTSCSSSPFITGCGSSSSWRSSLR